MTQMQSIVYSVVEEYVLKHGYAPSLEEIANEVPCSKSCAHYNVKKLLAEGYLESDTNSIHRSIRVPALEVRRRDNAKSRSKQKKHRES